MVPIKLLLLSADKDFSNQIIELLNAYSPDRYSYTCISDLNGEKREVDVALIDENVIEKDPTSYLARYSFELAPAPIIYLTDKLESAASFSAVKSLTTDYLIKGQLTPSGIHNCIKYALESWRLRMEIEKQQKRYQSLFYNAVDPAFFLTKDWQIENINQAFSSNFGITLHSLNKRSFGELLNDPDDFERLKHWIHSEQRHSIDCEFKFNRLDRRGIFLGHLKISVLREYSLENGSSDKKIAGYHGTLSNISYRERMRSIKENADRISMTYRLARTLAHEIRNPLTNITLATDQLKDELGQSDDADTYLQIINRCTRRIDNLISELLTSSERKPLDSSDCDLVDILQKALDNCNDRAELLGVDLQTDFEDNTTPYFCDGNKLQMAFTNLITNAMESIEHDDGRIIIGTYKEDGYICVYVEDNGSGMSEKQKESLFDPFYTSKKKGVGLGLTATRTIIAEHNGEIDVESAMGLGSTFTVLLPTKRTVEF